MPCIKIRISGSVYKTGFMYYLKAKADFSGITGVVFYEDDKSVGVIASGSKENINKFLKFCKEGYPNVPFCLFNLAQITNTEIFEVPHQEFSSFEVIHEKQETPNLPED